MSSSDPLQELTKRHVLAEAAQREREIRADLIEDVAAAITAVSVDRTTEVINRQAEAAVDAVADYYRRAAKRLT